MRKGYHNYHNVKQFNKRNVYYYHHIIPLVFYKKEQIKPKKLDIVERIDNFTSNIITIIDNETLNIEDLGRILRQGR